MQSTNAIRDRFLDFFKRNGHEVVASSPLVPRNDPTLLFTNAGMVQFKNVFTGHETRPYDRAVSSQKCVRAGGKHNDLENVGYTARHHTFFEMLGNFSFGDYFKEQAIDLAWSLVTREFGLSPERLLVTVYAEDDVAFDLWRKVAGLPDSRILRIATSDNFWAMGDTGPCGPCSEIFYDHGPAIPGGPPGSPDEDGDRFVEIWNLVFMQYEQVDSETRVDLPRPSIDTGMGLERMAAVLQGKHDNYDTDLFRTLIEAAADVTGTDPDGPQAVSHRVIADHLRASTFLMADGVMPSNEGRGYVLRRIMRRAMRHAHKLGARDPVMHRLVPDLVRLMGGQFGELERAGAMIAETLRMEEERFRATLDRGLKLLEEEVTDLAEGQDLSGDVAFKLYDTYGFPLDLTQDVLRGQGRGVDTDGFDAAMERQRAEARRSWAGSGEAADDRVWFALRERFGATEFLGYDAEQAEAVVLAVLVDGAEVAEATAGQNVAIVANQTPFYGESGGQVGDTGQILSGDGLRIVVTDVRKHAGDLWVHLGRIEAGTVSAGQAVDMSVDGERRSAIRANHSATHLLHEALRRRLGDHVAQKGSLVAPDRLRFDISHNQGMSAEDVAAVEAEVNARIRQNTDVVTRLMAPDDAVAQGAMALFGEKYGETVRVVSMGGADRDNRPFSVELCGGTHVRRTGDIGSFRLVGESALAAGVRRVEALTGVGAAEHAAQQEALLGQAATALRTTPQELPARVTALVDERKRLEREVTELRRKLAGMDGAATADGPSIKDVNGVRFAGRVLDGVPPKELKPMADDLKQRVGSGVVALVAVAPQDEGGKASIVVGVTPDLAGRLSAVDLVRVGSQAIGGKGGGGRPDMAQAGGPDGGRAGEALAAIERALA